MTLPAPLPQDVTGLVLAGGRGSRMGGIDKGLVDWGGEPLARHALQRLRPQVGAIALNANRNHAVYAGWGVPVWTDASDDYPGPLAGVLAGLRQCRTAWLATVPCDSPLFPHDLVNRLARAATDAGSPMAMAATASSPHPLAQPVFLLVHTSLRDDLSHALAAGERRVRRWAASQGAAMAVFDDAAAFANANTREELDGLRPDATPNRGG